MKRPGPEHSRESGYDWVALIIALVIVALLAVVTMEMWGH